MSGKFVVIVFLTVLWGGTATAQQPITARLVIPNDQQLTIMIKSALIALNNANLTGNYIVLRDLASPSFREANTPSRLAEIFASQRKDGLDISPILLLPPKLQTAASIDNRNLLRLVGYFETTPRQVDFSLAYEAINGQWRLFAIGVTTSDPGTPTNADPANSAIPLPTGRPEIEGSAKKSPRP